MSSYLLEHALIGDVVESDVLVEVDGDRFTKVEPGQAGSTPIPGLTLPGIANTHSHAFHRALRGRAQAQGDGSFWTWRDQMYAVAGRLDPDSYYRLAHAVYREMASVGITSVGEFHYLHHRPDGTPYDDPNAMSDAVVRAARDAGIRIALLDTCYLSSGFGEPVTAAQARFSDGSAERWAERVSAYTPDDDRGVVVGAAIHSVRAVPREEVPVVADWTAERGVPLHVHLSEQPAENDGCLAAYGVTPTRLLADTGALGPRTTAVHATHLTAADVGLLGDAATYAGFCPTTERDLADGIGPARALHDAGARLTLGSDSHAVVDPWEEMRAIEMHARLLTGRRGTWSAAELLGAATAVGQESLGWADAGRIAVGRRADLVTLDLHTPRTAGVGATAETAVFAATGADVGRVMVDGEWIFDAAQRADVAGALTEEIERIWS